MRMLRDHVKLPIAYRRPILSILATGGRVRERGGGRVAVANLPPPLAPPPGNANPIRSHPPVRSTGEATRPRRRGKSTKDFRRLFRIHTFPSEFLVDLFLFDHLPGVVRSVVVPELATPTSQVFMSDLNVQIPTAFDPFAEANAGDSGAAAGSKDYVHVRIQQRNGRKSLTTVQGLKKEFSYSKILKDLKKEFCCNGTVVQDPELGQVIQLQGDQRKNVSNFLVQAGIVKKEHIKIHGF
ncbi:hypothetical protein U9M48_015416 [Paspalum notatum var. saurae]|uniref:Protein translation factor SUI1 homolog n=1 Tax=Paspalum notatum var. saurae TaxID=547442 RepID=A0AAQ3T4E7_PASNO